MHIVIAPDSFKGSLYASEIIDIIKEEALRIMPYCRITTLPMADGGEGTMDVLMNMIGGTKIHVPVHGPLQEEVLSSYVILNNQTALIEMAAASGLPLIPEEKRNPEAATTTGTGELIRNALDKGCRKFVIGLGGSATNDGGIGALHALGIRFLDRTGEELDPVGGNLIRIAKIDSSNLHPGVNDSEFRIMCDIDNPLTGPRGATFVFSPQKGADPQMQQRLEQGMLHYKQIILKTRGIDPDRIPGTGAAGGLAAGLMTFLNGTLSSGIHIVLQMSHFEEIIKKADLVITGEGCADGQSAHGKVLWGIGTACSKYNVPVIALTGCLGDGYEELYHCGITEIIPNKTADMSMKYAIEHTRELLADNARRVFLRFAAEKQ